MIKINPHLTERKNIITVIVCIVVMAFATCFCSAMLRKNTTAQYSFYFRNIKTGTIAEENIYIKSSFDIIDTEATNENRKKVASSILPVFSFNVSEGIDVIKQFERYKKNSVYESNILLVSYNLLTDILAHGFFDEDSLENFRSRGYKSIYVNNSFNEKIYGVGEKTIDSLLCYNTLKSYIHNFLEENGANLTDADKQTVALIVNTFIFPNIHYDDILTREKIAEAVEETPPLVISFEKDEILIQKDKVVTPEQVRILEILSKKNSFDYIEVLGVFVISLICFSIVSLVYFAFSHSLSQKRFSQYYIITAIAVVINLASTYFLVIFSEIYLKFDLLESFYPVMFVPLLVTNISGKKRFGMCAMMLADISLVFLPISTIYTFFYVGLCGAGCIFISSFSTRRIDSILQWILSTLFCVAVTAVFTFVGSYSYYYLPIELLGLATHLFIANAVLTIITPILEQVFNLPTVFRLHDLSDNDAPLLKKLSQIAPGTFNHSRQVAELAFNAAVLVGANENLARVGALYHDIGKTEHPEYFTENQMSGENKHDEINPSLSKSIIKNHVSIGAEMAQEAHLPAEIVDIIANHHGNDVIQFFYREALKENNANTGEVQASDYSYSNAKIPETKECAIVMLADSIEATARSLTDPTPAKFNKLIVQTTLGKIERNQLDNSNLTMNDIVKVEQSFLRTLTAQYHSRIKYPDEEED